MLTIVKAPHPALQEPCAPINFANPGFSLHDLMQGMAATLMEAGGLGLAAPQIRRQVRAFVIREGAVVIGCFNPYIMERRGADVKVEGCLSYPELFLPITRAKRIKARWLNADGVEQMQDLTGLAARCFQHEYDHLEGITITNRVTPIALALARQKATRNGRRAANWPR